MRRIPTPPHPRSRRPWPATGADTASTQCTRLMPSARSRMSVSPDWPMMRRAKSAHTTTVAVAASSPNNVSTTIPGRIHLSGPFVAPRRHDRLVGDALLGQRRRTRR